MATIEILTDRIMPISDVKKNPMSLAESTKEKAVAVLNRNKPVMYCLSPEAFESMLDQIEDAKLAKLALERLNDGQKSVSVDLDEL
ncbi:type II toxin-antitoxin system Phd/YefM family antitoxin [Pleionea mediterranea]|jgi:antitoxin StbD|uniref:Antitoxin n=1 Tax=Pleionea mediterranea TaxID=523701 RepID=A0A316FEU1_9GAMM|nr:type II toxin-antitoxin system Phd/YefM family antitoxin [Pleionea mediterranea]PWK47384.1 antitoxin StbD [Pleionea mediterranea]